MVKSPPANAGNMGPIPNPGRYTCHGAAKLKEPQRLEPVPPRVHAPQQEKPLQGEACAPQLESSPSGQRKARAVTKTQHSQK